MSQVILPFAFVNGAIIDASQQNANFVALRDGNNDTDSKLRPPETGTLAARPAPGKAGRFYRTTDTNELFLDYGTGWIKVVQDADARLSDQRTPLDGSVTRSKLSGGIILPSHLDASVFGTTAGTAAAGNDSRLSNARTPTSHAASHAAGNSDAVTPASIGAATTSHAASHGAGAADAVTPQAINAVACPQEKLRLVRGSVNADATIARGTGFTVAKPTNGTYEVTFPASFGGTPSATASSRSGETVSVLPRSASAVEVHSLASSFAFEFIAVGPV